MQPIALECIVYDFHWGRLVSAPTDMHAPLNHSVSTRNHMQPATDPLFFTFISSFISLFTGWAGFRLLLFSGGLPSFSISAMFSLWYFCQYLRWGRERRGRERQRQLFTVARRRMSCSFSAARETLAMPPRACGARRSQPSSARILHGPCTSRLCESKERLSEGKKRDRGRGVRWNIIWRVGDQRYAISSRFPMECNQGSHIHLALLPHGDRPQAANRCPRRDPVPHCSSGEPTSYS